MLLSHPTDPSMCTSGETEIIVSLWTSKEDRLTIAHRLPSVIWPPSRQAFKAGCMSSWANWLEVTLVILHEWSSFKLMATLAMPFGRKSKRLLNKLSGRNQLYLLLIVDLSRFVPYSSSKQSCLGNSSRYYYWKSSRNCWQDPDEAKDTVIRAISKNTIHGTDQGRESQSSSELQPGPWWSRDWMMCLGNFQHICIYSSVPHWYHSCWYKRPMTTFHRHQWEPWNMKPIGKQTTVPDLLNYPTLPWHDRLIMCGSEIILKIEQ